MHTLLSLPVYMLLLLSRLLLLLLLAAAAAELIQQLVHFGWLAWGGKHAANRRATAYISESYFAEHSLEEMVGKKLLNLSLRQAATLHLPSVVQAAVSVAQAVVKLTALLGSSNIESLAILAARTG
jgi:hypothetical protein